jgi:RNA polymerase sigma-70 factor (ECF subfamily)
MQSTPDNADLEALIRAAQAGDKDALAQLLQSGLYIIHAAVKSRVPEDDVEDVLQEVRLAVWEALPRLNDPGRAIAWLRRITTRQIVNRHRNSVRAVPTESIPDDLQETETDLEDVESWAVVRKVLAGLPPRHQVVLVLRGVEELPFSEVGEEMGLTAEGAESLFRRAKLKILPRTTDFDPEATT